ncbi:Conserved_hypothetical protein [Hexamita inflata]|uniref:Uncharacterized protein n=1 Tax=Hexamita inflata TaxID=28002 RepID=A0AA86NZ90_9EUKA|nr:Conserved hypothetical protein [Hexamita inflata]
MIWDTSAFLKKMSPDVEVNDSVTNGSVNVLKMYLSSVQLFINLPEVPDSSNKRSNSNVGSSVLAVSSGGSSSTYCSWVIKSSSSGFKVVWSGHFVSQYSYDQNTTFHISKIWMQALLDEQAQLEKRKNQIMQQIIQKQLDNARIQQQTVSLYKQTQDFQKEIELLNEVRKHINEPIQYPTQRLEQEFIQSQSELERQRELLLQEKVEFQQISNQVNKLKGLKRSVGIISAQSSKLVQFDSTRLVYNSKIYELSQIGVMGQLTNLIPNDSTFIRLFGSLSLKQQLLEQLIDEIFAQLSEDEAILFSGINQNSDIFDPQNEPTLFQQFNNLLQIPVRNKEHLNSILSQIQLQSEFLLVFEASKFIDDEVKVKNFCIGSVKHELIQQLNITFEIQIGMLDFTDEAEVMGVLEEIEQVSGARSVDVKEMHGE